MGGRGAVPRAGWAPARHVVRKEAEVPGLEEGDREEGRSEGRKTGKGGRKRARGREVPVLEELGALPSSEVEREGGPLPFLLPGVPASRGGSGSNPFSFSLRIDVLLLTREEAAAAEDGVAESVNSAPLLGGGAGR